MHISCNLFPSRDRTSEQADCNSPEIVAPRRALIGQVPSGTAKRLQTQPHNDAKLWHGFHEMAEKSSRIIPLGAHSTNPLQLFPNVAFCWFRTLYIRSCPNALRTNY